MVGIAGLVAMLVADIGGRSVDPSGWLVFAGMAGVPVFRSADLKREQTR